MHAKENIMRMCQMMRLQGQQRNVPQVYLKGNGQILVSSQNSNEHCLSKNRQFSFSIFAKESYWFVIIYNYHKTIYSWCIHSYETTLYQLFTILQKLKVKM